MPLFYNICFSIAVFEAREREKAVAVPAAVPSLRAYS